jgi:hypothetical protein
MGWRDQSRPVVGSVAGPAAPEAPVAGPTPGAPATAYSTLSQTGAPFKVRAAVGSARERDRLATLRQFYPDAQPTDDGNYVFTDPKSGRLTVYNPRGLDLGDLFSAPRELAETGAAIAGGTVAMPSGPAGMVAGAALGSAAADRAVDIGRQALGYPQTVTPRTLAQDTATDLAVGATGEMGGQILQQAPRALLRPVVRPDAAPVAAAADRLGVPPTSALLGGRFMQGSQALAANTLPGSAGHRATERLVDQLQREASQAVPGNPLGRQEGARVGGATLKEAAIGADRRFQVVREEADRQVYAAMGGQRVPMTQLQTVVNDLNARIAQAPGTFEPVLGPVRDRLQAYLADAAAQGGSLPPGTFRNLRTLLGQELAQPAITTQRLPEANNWYEAAYGAMSQDLGAAAQAAGPRAHQLWQRHDRLVRAYRGERGGRNLESIADSLDKIVKEGSDEQAWNALSTGGVNRMANVLNRVKDQGQREIIARATWDRLLTTAQGNPNLSYLVKQWNVLDPEKRRLVFGQVADMGHLNDLMTVLNGMREADLGRNFSNTAYALIQASMTQQAGRAILDNALALATTGVAAQTGTLEEAMKGYAAGWMMSYAMHRPAVARAMSDMLQGRPVPMTPTLRKELARLSAEIQGRSYIGRLVEDGEGDQPAR